MSISNIDEDIKQAEAALEQKKAEYWIQQGVLMALRHLKEREDATGNGRAVPDNEPESSTNS